VPTVFASDAKKAVCEDATTKVGLELVKHEGRQFAAPRFQICQKRRPVLLYGSIEQSRFGQELDKLHTGLDRMETRSASSRNGTLTEVLLSK
jgi:hypothetical protein